MIHATRNFMIGLSGVPFETAKMLGFSYEAESPLICSCGQRMYWDPDPEDCGLWVTMLDGEALRAKIVESKDVKDLMPTCPHALVEIDSILEKYPP